MNAVYLPVPRGAVQCSAAIMLPWQSFVIATLHVCIYLSTGAPFCRSGSPRQARASSTRISRLTFSFRRLLRKSERFCAQHRTSQNVKRKESSGKHFHLSYFPLFIKCVEMANSLSTWRMSRTRNRWACDMYM